MTRQIFPRVARGMQIHTPNIDVVDAMPTLGRTARSPPLARLLLALGFPSQKQTAEREQDGAHGGPSDEHPKMEAQIEMQVEDDLATRIDDMVDGPGILRSPSVSCVDDG